jgi:sirohydrochlorin ferrochelatase
MRRRGEFDIVQAAFLELAEPTISDAGARCVQQGAQCVVMLPYFLSAGVHVRRDLAALRGELTSRFPNVEFRLAEPLGQHPQLLEVVAARAQQAMRIPSEPEA